MATCKQCGTYFVGKRKDAKYCKQACGSNFRNRKHRKINSQTSEYKAKVKAQAAKDNSTPYGRYVQHKHRAKQSNVAFNLSFRDWLNIWGDKYSERGLGKLVMCRNSDQGAYEVGNVRIDTQANNNREAHNLRRT